MRSTVSNLLTRPSPMDSREGLCCHVARKRITQDAAGEGEDTAQPREKFPTVYAVIETLGLGSDDE